jgi:hypothetical protein
MKSRYGFAETLVIATASNPALQLTDAARIEKQVQKAQDATASPEEAGPKPSTKVSLTLVP